MIGPTFLLPVPGVTMPDAGQIGVEGGEDFPTALLAATLVGGPTLVTPDLPEGALEAALESMFATETTEEEAEATEGESAIPISSVDESSLLAAMWQPLAPGPVEARSAQIAEVDPTVVGEVSLDVVAPSQDGEVGLEVDGQLIAEASAIEMAPRAEAVPEAHKDQVSKLPDAADNVANDPALTVETLEGAPAQAQVIEFEAAPTPVQDAGGDGFDPSGRQPSSHDFVSQSGPAGSRVEAGASPAAQQTSQAARRVMDIVERLENQPPPRQMVVELPELEGLRLQVSLRGSGVHVAVMDGGSPAQLRPLTSELAHNLAERGFELADFSDAEQRNRQAPDEQAPETFTFGGRDGGRARKTDSQLRL